MDELEWETDFTRYTHEVRDGYLSYRTVVPEGWGLREVAEVFTSTYDHGIGDPEVYVVAIIENLLTGAEVRFAFNDAGDFEWQTDREYTSC